MKEQRKLHHFLGWKRAKNVFQGLLNLAVQSNNNFSKKNLDKIFVKCTTNSTNKYILQNAHTNIMNKLSISFLNFENFGWPKIIPLKFSISNQYHYFIKKSIFLQFLEDNFFSRYTPRRINPNAFSNIFSYAINTP